MIDLGVVIAAVVSLLERLADLLIQWRIAKGSQITGAPSASVLERMAALVDKWGATDFPGMTKEQANKERRAAVLREAKLIGIDLSEKYLRWLIESVLIRKDAEQ